MSSEITYDQQYKVWLSDFKNKVRNAQIKAAVKVNTELLTLYWELGADIVSKQAETKWGDGFLLQLSKDLTEEFPDMKGFSERNLKYIRQWYSFYASALIAIGQQAIAQLTKQPVSQLPTGGKSQQSVGLIGQQPVALITQIPRIALRHPRTGHRLVSGGYQIIGHKKTTRNLAHIHPVGILKRTAYV